MVDKQRDAFQAFRAVSVINPLEAGDNTLFGNPDLANLKSPLIGLVAQWAVGFDIQRVLCVALDHHLAMYSMDADDDAQA